MYSIGKHIFLIPKVPDMIKFNQPVFVTYLPGSLTSMAGASKPQTKKSGTMYLCVTQENLIGITLSKYFY